MEKRIVTVANLNGVHMRPSVLIMKTASNFESRVEIRFKDQVANAKSFTDIMSLGMERGASVTIEAEGSDEHLAADAIAGLFDKKFGEWSLYD